MTSQILKSGFYENTKILEISREQNIFSSNKKNDEFNIKGFFRAKNSFVVKANFNSCINFKESRLCIPIKIMLTVKICFYW